MAIHLPQIEDSGLTNYIPPNGEYQHFLDDVHYAEKVREWGLSTTKEVKKEFWYKSRTYQRIVTIKGYESYGITAEYNTLVIEFKDGRISCISPALLKEMQSPSFTKETILQAQDSVIAQASSANTHENSVSELDETKPKLAAEKINVEQGSSNRPTAKKPKPAKEKAPKLILPEEKVHFTAKVKQFALSWNHFNEENDEVVVLEDVRIESEEPLEVGLAWCSHSKTLKKFELQPGEALEFDGKIVKKSLPKGKDVEDEAFRLDVAVAYKVNNPSKLVKK